MSSSIHPFENNFSCAHTEMDVVSDIMSVFSQNPSNTATCPNSSLEPCLAPHYPVATKIAKSVFSLDDYNEFNTCLS